MSRMYPASHTLRLLTIAMSGALGIAYPLASSAHTKTGAHKSGKVIHITGVRKTGRKAHAPLKAAYTEHAIGTRAIRHASPAQNAQTILARKPSINAFSTGPNGVRSTITFRSFTSGQFTETFDGIPLNDMFNGAATNSASMRNAIPLTLAEYTFGKPVALPYQHSTRAKSRRSGYSQISLMGMICLWVGHFLPRPAVFPTGIQLAAL